jgi:hypothetical protein
MLVAFAVYGCVLLPPVPPKSEVTPKLNSGAEKNIALAVIEARVDVLNGQRPTQFEGVVLAPFLGPSITATHRHYAAGERFVDYLAGMIKDGLSEAGTNVAVVSVPNGTSMEEASKQLSETGAGRYIVMRVNESNWNYRVGSAGTSYKYDFRLVVAGKGGILGIRNFSGERAYSIRGIDHYNVYDMHSVIYRIVIEEMFSDPTVKQALGS